jgi:hypothetical protein
MWYGKKMQFFPTDLVILKVLKHTLTVLFFFLFTLYPVAYTVKKVSDFPIPSRDVMMSGCREMRGIIIFPRQGDFS